MIVERLNARFNAGRPSNDIGLVGVMMRNFEGMAGRYSAAWEPCSDNEFCARAGDRLAASVVNARMPHLYSFDAGGVVISPASAKVLCSYHGDGNDLGRFCRPPTDWLKMPVEYEPDGSCIPGCTSHFGWCDDKFNPCPLCEEVHCAWRPSGLAKMVDAHVAKLDGWRAQKQGCAKGGHYGRSRCHNEVVLDAAAWTSHMPHTIEAVFYQAKSTVASIAEARGHHRELLQRYGLGAQAVPLVVYDGAQEETPFALADGPSSA